MKHGIQTLLLAATWTLIACSGNDPERISLNGTWKVVSFHHYRDNTITFQTPENSGNHDIVISFNGTQLPGTGTFEGRVTTNSVGGNVEYMGNREFRFLNVTSTFVAQPAWGDMFSEVMGEKPVRYTLTETFLHLYYDNGTKSVTLQREAKDL